MIKLREWSPNGSDQRDICADCLKPINNIAQRLWMEGKGSIVKITFPEYRLPQFKGSINQQ